MRIPKGDSVEIEDLWLKWGVREDPVDHGVTVWIAEGGPREGEITMTANDIERLDLSNVFMDAQQWQQIGTAGAGSNVVQTLTEGVWIDFDEEIEAFDDDVTLNLYQLGEGGSDIALKFIVIAKYTHVRTQRVYADDFSEYAIGTNWEETVPVSE